MSTGNHGVIGYVRCWSCTQTWGVRGLLENLEAQVICLLCTGTWDVIIMSARKLGNILAISIMSALCWDVGCSSELSARKLGDVPIMSALYSNLGGTVNYWPNSITINRY